MIFKGTFLACLGALILLIFGIFAPLSILKTFGFPIFLLGIFLIKIGLGPYKKISQLELFPHELILSREDLCYRIKGKTFFSLPISCIEKIAYFDQMQYGIVIKLKNPLPKKIVLKTTPSKIKKFHKKSLKITGFDLFFPFFYRSSFEKFFKNLSDLRDLGTKT